MNPAAASPSANPSAAVPHPHLHHWLAVARQAALDAGKAILEIYHQEDFGIEAKADQSPLTKADQAAHQIISHALAATHLPILSEEGKEIPFPQRAAWDWFWLVDPLDGTKEFIKRNGEFTVNIALLHKTVAVAGVVYAPCLNTLYWGAKETGVFKESPAGKELLLPCFEKNSLETLRQKSGVRLIASRTHQTHETQDFIAQFPHPHLTSMGSSLKFLLLAEGKADLYPRFAPTMEWDTAASHALLNALNRSIYQPNLQQELVYNKPNLLNPSFVAM
ncbi:3'(2'),5'-bisphosphate nucleotidase CysQ [Rufibacter ruber]|uniref:3'(2'),5'-bisphosphate nucleotidase CysQ n=1 Tax=Rufibacter ruber TaxID=1783499 RepID=UPI0009ED307F|nr:3'(2'),5'-bisphosphate nucleotidase CysQ [Rufibacter ruber]